MVKLDLHHLQSAAATGWLDYNHLYIFGKSLHQQEYKILRKGFEGGLSKRQISNVFNSQEMLHYPLIAIEKYSGVRNGEIRADVYDDCQNIPDPPAPDPTQKKLLLDDCFLGKQNKAEAYYTRGRHNYCDTIYIAQNYFAYPAIQFRRIQTLLSFSHKTRRISHISMLTIVLVTYPSCNSNSFVIKYGVKITTL